MGRIEGDLIRRGILVVDQQLEVEPIADEQVEPGNAGDDGEQEQEEEEEEVIAPPVRPPRRRRRNALELLLA